MAACSCDEEPPLAKLIPAIAVQPEQLDLGATPVGLRADHTLEIVSLGSADLDVTSITLVAPAGGTLSPDLALALDEQLPWKLVPSQKKSFQLRHLPGDDQLDSGVIRIQSSDPAKPTLDVPIVQTAQGAPRVEAVPNPDDAEAEAGTPGGVRRTIRSIRFDNIPVGQAERATFFVVNVGGGNLPLTVNRIAFVEQNVGPELELVVDPNPSTMRLFLPALGGQVRPMGTRSVRVQVAWTPRVAGSTVAATIRIETSDPAKPTFDIPINGMTQGVDPPRLRLTPMAGLDFGQVAVGSMVQRSFSAQNDGGSALAIQPLSLGANPGNVFALVETPVVVMIPPGQSRTFNVTFAPTTAGNASGTVRIATNDPAAAQTDYPLSGNGTMVMTCTPATPDPNETANDMCATATNRGAVVLMSNQTTTRTWNDGLFDRAMDGDWSRFDVTVSDGCDLVGYDFNASVTLPAGESAEVCVLVGDCTSETRCNQGSGTVSARKFLFPGDDVCHMFNNTLPVYVQVRHISGERTCQPYTVNLRLR